MFILNRNCIFVILNLEDYTLLQHVGRSVVLRWLNFFAVKLQSNWTVYMQQFKVLLSLRYFVQELIRAIEKVMAKRMSAC